ncbi:MAG: DUF1761 domain-containing protein [Pseudomonadota bacterium]
METSTLIAAVSGTVGAFLLGGLWYSPILFGKTWQRLSTYNETAPPNPAVAYGGAFVLLLISAVIFGAFLGPNPGFGFAMGAALSAGFAWAAGSTWVSDLFEGRPLRLSLINGGYMIGLFAIFGLAFGTIG